MLCQSYAQSCSKVCLTKRKVIYLHKDRNIKRNCISNTIQYPLIPSLIGCAAAFSSTYPFDSYKIRLQNNNQNNKTLFAGYIQGVLLCCTYAAVYFISYEKMINVLCLSINEASTIATSLSLLLKVPSKVVIKSMQKGEYNTIWQVINIIKKRDGFKGFFRGFWIYAFNDIPENVVKYNMYAFLNFIFPSDAILVGMIAGIFTSVLTQPLDVLQNIIMSNIENKKINFKKINYFSGLLISLITNSIQSAIFFNVMKYTYNLMIHVIDANPL